MVRPWVVVCLVLGACACSANAGSSIGETGDARCANDFDCQYTQTCDTTSGQCVDGAARQWVLEGSASCTLDTTSPDDKGVALVISTDDQGPVEITDSTTCTSVPSLGLIAIRVLGAQASAVNVYLPVSVAETGGRAPIVPFVVGKYPTDGAMAEVAQGQYSVGYAVSGYIDVLTSGVASQAAVSIELSATWQRLAMQTTACDAPCTSQLDCGVSDGTGLMYPVCTRAEITDIPVCSLYCDPADTAACTSRGGQCDTRGRCRRPCR